VLWYLQPKFLFKHIGINDFDFWERDFFQRVEILVVAYDEFGVGGDGTIYKFIIILIG
jgi:hypothetical protein